MKSWLVFLIALGGILYGYNTAVIAGALPFLNQEFQLSLVKQGAIVSIILIGAFFGSACAGTLADRYGRRPSTYATACVYIIGIFITMKAPSLEMLVVGRLITGFAVGLSSVIAPLYLAEIAPAKQRGACVGIYQLAIASGILIAYLASYAFSASGNWRYMIAVGSIPAIVQLVSLRSFSETPHWLSLQTKKETLSPDKQGWRLLFHPSVLPVLLIGACLSILQQVTGINTVIYYAPQIFEMAGFSSLSLSLLVSCIIGVMNVAATFFAIRLIDRLGRRKLLLISLGGMVMSLALLSALFFSQSKSIDFIAPLSLVSYVVFFALGLGPVVWVWLSEVYPLHVRGRAMSIALGVNWIANYLVSLTFLDLVSLLTAGGAFCLYGLLAALGVLFVFRFIPETKGKSLEEIERIFKRKGNL